MKIAIWSVGKADESYIKEGVTNFTKRIGHYYPIERHLIIPSKASDPTQIKKEEAVSIFKTLAQNDVLILLDEKGKMLSSPGLAKLIQQKANQSAHRIVFLIGVLMALQKILSQSTIYLVIIRTRFSPYACATYISGTNIQSLQYLSQ